MKKSDFAGQRFKWDSKLVTDAVGRVKAEALRLTALDIQRTSKRSMKKPKKGQLHSDPNTPPFVHSGAYKNSIRFAWDENNRSVVVGAVKYKGQSKGAKALEHGGLVEVKIKQTVIRSDVSKRKFIGSEKGYFGSTIETSRISQRKKKRGLPMIPLEQEKHIKEYYEDHYYDKGQYEKTITKKVMMQKRPALNPALEKEVKKMPERLKRAAKKFK
jgi:hypothetical protein